MFISARKSQELQRTDLSISGLGIPIKRQGGGCNFYRPKWSKVLKTSSFWRREIRSAKLKSFQVCVVPRSCREFPDETFHLGRTREKKLCQVCSFTLEWRMIPFAGTRRIATRQRAECLVQFGVITKFIHVTNFIALANDPVLKRCTGAKTTVSCDALVRDFRTIIN